MMLLDATTRMHFRLCLLTLAVPLALLSGCASTVTIRELQSPVPVSSRAGMPVSVELIPVVPGSVQNYFFVPLTPNFVIGTPMGAPQHLYHLRYQEEFVGLLGTELVRKGVATHSTIAPASPPASRTLAIQVAFLRAVFNPNFNQYMLDVAVGVSGHRNGFIKRYQVRSTESENVLQTLNNDSNAARVKVSANLLDHVLRDIDVFLGGSLPNGALDPTAARASQPS